MKKLSIIVLATAIFSSALNAEELKMYACGVTRVAFMTQLNEAFEKNLRLKLR